MVIPKKRGRPATGRDPLLTGRVPAQTIKAVEEWAAREGCTKSEALRRLIQRGLNSTNCPCCSKPDEMETTD